MPMMKRLAPGWKILLFQSVLPYVAPRARESGMKLREMFKLVGKQCRTWKRDPNVKTEKE